MTSAVATSGRSRVARDRPRRRLDLTLLGLAPFALVLLVFLLIPIVVNIAAMFLDASGSFTTANLLRLAGPQYLQAYLQSALISAITAAVGGVLGTVLAWALVTLSRPRWLLLLARSFVPVASQFAGIPLAFAFVATLGVQGYLTVALTQATGIQLTDHIRLSSSVGVVLVYLYFQIPLMAVLMTPALEGIRPQWRESALSLGGGRLRYLLTVLLPILAPAIGGSLLTLFANSFSAYATAFALTGGRMNLVPIQIGFFVSGNVLLDPGFGAALATGMMCAIALTLVLRWLITRRTSAWLA